MLDLLLDFLTVVAVIGGLIALVAAAIIIYSWPSSIPGRSKTRSTDND
jgi:hypothetical protein